MLLYMSIFCSEDDSEKNINWESGLRMLDSSTYITCYHDMIGKINKHSFIIIIICKRKYYYARKLIPIIQQKFIPS